MSSDPANVFLRCIASVLLEERLKQGLSKKKLSELCGIDRTGLVRAESGNINSTLRFLFHWCKGLGLEVSEAMKRAEARLAAETPSKAARPKE